jgi:NAD(P)-dependent dehydrogenase (short-subunit alcohol dehydrogenase family)
VTSDQRPLLVENKIALVTGAGSGIGRGSALVFAREGARVAVADVNEELGRETVRLVRDAGGTAEFIRCDVARDDEVAAMVGRVVELWGRLDCAHNNAGITTQGGPLQELTLEEWHRTLAVNLSGVFYCMRHEIPVMLTQGGGAIVNTSSGAGLVAAKGLAHYCAAKHGILGLTKTAAQELARTGVRVNAVCPGIVETPTLLAYMARSPEIAKAIQGSTARGIMGRPEEIGEAVVWLCSDRAAYVNGESMLVDGGTVAR